MLPITLPEKFFPESKILMCYFYKMQNVLKNYPVYFKTPEEFEVFWDAVHFIHMPKSPSEYLERKESFKTLNNLIQKSLF